MKEKLFSMNFCVTGGIMPININKLNVMPESGHLPLFDVVKP